MKKISVIIPVYNVEKYLKRCLDSLLNQKYKNVELIVVNDGSPDNSQKIIDEYAKKDSRVVSIIKENGGQASARNLGLTKATGDYISFIDSDDYVEKDIYSSLKSYMEKDYDIVIFDYNIVFKDSIKKEESCTCVDSDNVTVKEYLLCGGVSPWNKIYKRDYLEKCEFKFPEGIIYEDYAAIPTLGKFNPKTAYVNKYLVDYVQSDESTMRTAEYKDKYENLFPATEYLYEQTKDFKEQEEVEYLICRHNLYHGALNFYKYGKLEQIDRISDSMREKFPKWRKNKYFKKLPLREKTLMTLFYYKKYGIIRFIQKIKGSA